MLGGFSTLPVTVSRSRSIPAAAIDDAVGWIFFGVATAIIKQGDNFSWLPFLGQAALIIHDFWSPAESRQLNFDQRLAE